MNDPNPGSSTAAQRTPTNKPVVFDDDGQFRHEGDWNSFQFSPPLTHEDTLLLAERAEELGYKMLFRRADYSMEQVQDRLVESGPSYFLNMTMLEEDISPKELPPTAEKRMADRMQELAPETELIITDPYLFTGSRKSDSEVYAASVGNMLAPALTAGLHVTAVVSRDGNNSKVRKAVEAELYARMNDLTISVIESSDFHDRFWIADRSRGLIVGASLNKIGSKIFFVDELSEVDVRDVLAEVENLVAAQDQRK